MSPLWECVSQPVVVRNGITRMCKRFKKYTIFISFLHYSQNKN